ncbi:GGDEF domain-containing protein [Aquincola tertiaricarbonis]|uniref:GGDEF domain-containing protein n=1 Tax=Aquincola tertiaricarbonis TaxID=391953 RepID=A0ABY4S7M6_AQUTE|nr:GGDEF domain-containing protein [Aquincola tertiaricarbonis]URI07244.1 GGDEF domain-containing protein [Aquincola tertiaricarbonis]
MCCWATPTSRGPSLTHLSERDALTGLFNRAGFDRHLADLAATDDGRMAALLYIDLDHFKPVNDRYGHPAGDELLQRFGQALAGLVRPHDVTARLGGDEFAILLRHIPDTSVAERVAASVVKAAARPFTVGGHPVHIGASVGVAVAAGGTVAADLVARADAALYEAKRRGRGTVALGAAAAEAEA